MNSKHKEGQYKPWSLEYHGYDPKKEKSRESLLAVGNGYLGVRGALEETRACDTNYPGTYMAGLYNRLVSKVAGKDIENEDFVNCPNWAYINFRIGDTPWLDINKTEIISFKRILDLSTGKLTRELVVKGNKGNETAITSSRVASMDNPHLAAIQYTIKPLNYSGEIELISSLDGNIINDGVPRYRELNQQHLKPVEEGYGGNTSWLVVETTQSGIEVAQAARHTTLKNGNPMPVKSTCKTTKGKVDCFFPISLERNEVLTLEKVVAIHTSKPDDVKSPLAESKNLLKNVGSFNTILEASGQAWKKIWDKIDIQIEGDPKSQMLARLHLYHLMVAASPHNVNIDAGIAARGLHGEAYRGHIFWDELYILPLYCIFMPDVAKSILNYRYRRINKAREYAKEYGYKGAMFPWQSGSDGREETQVIHLNPVSGKWGDDYSSLQRHISIAIAYNTWYYFQVTEDMAFMEEAGAELFLEICRFWASKSVFDEATGRFSISKVMGPDEFHEQHKASKGGGVKDNAYTNIMVAWLFKEAEIILEKMPESAKEKTLQKISLSTGELEGWKKISTQLNIPVSEEGIIEQFDGYFGLKELDWDGYRKKYNNIYRLDRILKAEGKSPDEYKLAKQADTLMAFYNLDEETISGIMEGSGYQLPEGYLEKNYTYYLNRTSHGSTLSRVVHAYLANLFGGSELGSQLYFEALGSDYTDIQGGTTAEGIHAGVMAGTALMAITSFAGVNFKKECLSINPVLPENWKCIKFNFTFKNAHYFVEVKPGLFKIEIKNDILGEVLVEFSNKKINLPTNKVIVLDY